MVKRKILRHAPTIIGGGRLRTGIARDRDNVIVVDLICNLSRRGRSVGERPSRDRRDRDDAYGQPDRQSDRYGKYPFAAEANLTMLQQSIRPRSYTILNHVCFRGAVKLVSN